MKRRSGRHVRLRGKAGEPQPLPHSQFVGFLTAIGPIANLYAVFATSGSYQKRPAKREPLSYDGHSNTRPQAAPKIRDRRVTAEDIWI